MEVNYINSTPDGEATIAYCARVSSPNQDNPEYEKLLRYCWNHGHYSIFEMADLTLEINTSRAISAQLLRHKSFSFQEFSQRYSVVPPRFEIVGARSQDPTNRQSSHDDLDKYTKDWFRAVQEDLFSYSHELYEEALRKGIAKECARNLLPLASPTRLYMKGNIRSWMTYLQTRLDKSTQLEHRKVAESCYKIMSTYYPICASLINKETV